MSLITEKEKYLIYKCVTIFKPRLSLTTVILISYAVFWSRPINATNWLLKHDAVVKKNKQGFICYYHLTV